MPWLIIIIGLAGLILVIIGYAVQELARPYPEEREAKHKSRMEAERLRRHAERDQILAHAELIDQKTKAEIKRQYMKDQSPPGTFPDEPEDEIIPDAAQIPDNIRHRIKFETPTDDTPPEPAKPDTRNLRQGLAQRPDDTSDQTRTPSRSGFNIHAALEQARQENEYLMDTDDMPMDDTRQTQLSGLFQRTAQPDLTNEAQADIPVDEPAPKKKPGLFGKKPKPEPDNPDELQDSTPDTIKPKKKSGLFGKKSKPEPDITDETQEDTPTDEPMTKKKPGLFRKKSKPAETPEPDLTDQPEPKRKKTRGLSRKKLETATTPEPESVPDGEAQNESKPGKKKSKTGISLFGRKKKPAIDEIPNSDEDEPNIQEPVHLDLTPVDQTLTGDDDQIPELDDELDDEESIPEIDDEPIQLDSESQIPAMAPNQTPMQQPVIHNARTPVYNKALISEPDEDLLPADADDDLISADEDEEFIPADADDEDVIPDPDDEPIPEIDDAPILPIRKTHKRALDETDDPDLDDWVQSERIQPEQAENIIIRKIPDANLDDALPDQSSKKKKPGPLSRLFHKK